MRPLIFLFIAFILVHSQQAYSQSQITGIVKDSTTGQPIGYALVKSTTAKTWSGLDGKFQLAVTSDDTTLLVSATFYQTREIRIQQTKDLEIRLLPEDQNIETVTVTAHRIESRLLNTTGAVSVITASRIAGNSPVALEPSLNQVPGVLMHTGSFNTNRITIRGIGSRTP